MKPDPPWLPYWLNVLAFLFAAPPLAASAIPAIAAYQWRWRNHFRAM